MEEYNSGGIEIKKNEIEMQKDDNTNNIDQKNKLALHNQKIIKMIKKTKEYRVLLRIKVLYEEIMKRNPDENRKKIYEQQYNTANRIFIKKIAEYSKNFPKIEEE